MKDQKTTEREIRMERAQGRIVQAMRDFFDDPSLEARSGGVIKIENYHETLTHEDINRGVMAFILVNKLASGSSGSVQLNTLLESYLLDPKKREAINRMVRDLKS